MEIEEDEEFQRLLSLSIKELKQILEGRKVDFRDCVEKKDLIKRIKESAHLPQQPPTNAPAAGTPTHSRHGSFN